MDYALQIERDILALMRGLLVEVQGRCIRDPPKFCHSDRNGAQGLHTILLVLHTGKDQRSEALKDMNMALWSAAEGKKAVKAVVALSSGLPWCLQRTSRGRPHDWGASDACT